MSRQQDIYDCIYNNVSACGGSNKPLGREDIQYLPLDIRKEDVKIKLDELHNPRTWEVEGGYNRSKYPKEWTPKLKKAIKSRDGYICFICKDEERAIAHHVHHIDYDKWNCDESNLITLCSRCHMKTNKNREYWLSYFTEALVVTSL
jgi:hypothetical protein